MTDVTGARVVDGADRPIDTKGARRPNPKKRLPLGQTESEHSRKARMRATDHMNEELAEDLRRNLTVVVGCTSTWTPSVRIPGEVARESAMMSPSIPI
jgi:hypothetical protein